MLIHADFSRRAAVAPHQYLWVASPQTGVERVMLDRVGEEQARATSIVRYAPGARYPHHLHPGGEEILVLSGCFSDGDAHYPAGWYVRNPPGSGHQPYSAGGALIFVKLHQMPPEETRAVRIDSGDPSSWQRREGGLPAVFRYGGTGCPATRGARHCVVDRPGARRRTAGAGRRGPHRNANLCARRLDTLAGGPPY
jgi:anti-sigma factor ChrR (cupin superfamily)